MAYKRRNRRKKKEEKRQKIKVLVRFRDKFLLRQCFGKLYIHAIDAKRANETLYEKKQRKWRVLCENYKNATGEKTPYILKVWFYE